MQSPDFIEASFPTIAGVGSNGAIIHYRAEASSPLHKTLTPSTPILIDSGGQYTMGTTDVTRTWQFGEPTPVFSSHFTNVLKGNIGIDSCIFPENTPGVIIDSFARRALWNSGCDYGHGTGHGVGAALNVHEGPASISPRMGNKEPLKIGMVLSNEPGYYEPGNFGIRIENLLIVKEKGFDRGSGKKKTKKVDGAKNFLQFERLTMIPIQKSLIDLTLMTSEELDWLDSYHAEIWDKVGGRLEDGTDAKVWLEEACKKVQRERVEGTVPVVA
jgi:Xaa-Pro aminopeptidase